jgi:hypothetical protein
VHRRGATCRDPVLHHTGSVSLPAPGRRSDESENSRENPIGASPPAASAATPGVRPCWPVRRGASPRPVPGEGRAIRRGGVGGKPVRIGRSRGFSRPASARRFPAMPSRRDNVTSSDIGICGRALRVLFINACGVAGNRRPFRDPLHRGDRRRVRLSLLRGPTAWLEMVTPAVCGGADRNQSSP